MGAVVKWYHYTIIVFLITGGGAMAYYKSRGLRNKNPGNIRKSNDTWQGLSAVQTDPDFFQFTDAKYGIRAMARIIDNYKKRGLYSIEQIIATWAPSNENDTQSYIMSVRKSTKWPQGWIPVKEEGDYLPLIKAIIKHENGLNPYSDELIREGISLA